MWVLNKFIFCCFLFFTQLSVASAISTFGALASGSDLDPYSNSKDGGAGFSSAAVNGSNYKSEARLGGSTYTPVLKAMSESSGAINDDDVTSAVAEAYQTFTSSITQSITLNISLDGVVTNDGTVLSRSSVLADVFVIGGDNFNVADTSGSCVDFKYKYAFGTYLCGDTLGRSNLYIPDGDVTLVDTLTFNVTAGDQFAVYGVLRANARDGSSDAFNTLQMNFDDDTYITPVPLPAAAWLFISGLMVIITLTRRKHQN